MLSHVLSHLLSHLLSHSLDKDKDKNLFIDPQEFVVGYTKAPEQPQSSARPICHSHVMTSTGREPATIHIAAKELAALRTASLGHLLSHTLAHSPTLSHTHLLIHSLYPTHLLIHSLTLHLTGSLSHLVAMYPLYLSWLSDSNPTSLRDPSQTEQHL